ncbi:MAG: helix-turn-helix domain-containing protein, partial [Acidobacteriota bacterium]
MGHLKVSLDSSTPDPDFIKKLEKSTAPEAGFPGRLTALRRGRGMTQQGLADAVGLGISQVKRYEAGGSQPTLDVIRNLALDLPPFLRQRDKTQNPTNGELSHGFVTQAVHQGIQAGRR